MQLEECFENLVESFRGALESNANVIRAECQSAEMDAKIGASVSDEDPVPELKLSMSFRVSLFGDSIHIRPEFKVGHNATKKIPMESMKLDNAARLPGLELKKVN